MRFMWIIAIGLLVGGIYKANQYECSPNSVHCHGKLVHDVRFAP